jgi:hypothetical protein
MVNMSEPEISPGAGITDIESTVKLCHAARIVTLSTPCGGFFLLDPRLYILPK